MGKYVIIGGLIGFVYTFFCDNSKITAFFFANPLARIVYAYFAIPVWALRVQIGYSSVFSGAIVYVSFAIVGMIIGLVIYKIRKR